MWPFPAFNLILGLNIFSKTSGWMIFFVITCLLLDKTVSNLKYSKIYRRFNFLEKQDEINLNILLIPNQINLIIWINISVKSRDVHLADSEISLSFSWQCKLNEMIFSARDLMKNDWIDFKLQQTWRIFIMKLKSWLIYDFAIARICHRWFFAEFFNH